MRHFDVYRIRRCRNGFVLTWHLHGEPKILEVNENFEKERSKDNRLHTSNLHSSKTCFALFLPLKCTDLAAQMWNFHPKSHIFGQNCRFFKKVGLQRPF